MSKVLVGIPCMESLPVEYVNCLLQLKKPEGTNIMHDPMSLVYIARQRIIEYAIQHTFSHVMFIDSDMVFPPDALIRLLEHDLDVVGCLAFQRKPPYTPCAYKTLKAGRPGEVICEPLTEYERGLVEVDGIGMGCTLIKAEVFNEIHKQGFPCYHPMVGYGEDLSFCLRARKSGYKIHVDTTFQAGHIGKQICTEQTWKRFEVGE